jgi:hypothetical protein
VFGVDEHVALLIGFDRFRAGVGGGLVGWVLSVATLPLGARNRTRHMSPRFSTQAMVFPFDGLMVVRPRTGGRTTMDAPRVTAVKQAAGPDR